MTVQWDVRSSPRIFNLLTIFHGIVGGNLHPLDRCCYLHTENLLHIADSVSFIHLHICPIIHKLATSSSYVKLLFDNYRQYQIRTDKYFKKYSEVYFSLAKNKENQRPRLYDLRGFQNWAARHYCNCCCLSDCSKLPRFMQRQNLWQICVKIQ